MPKLNVRYVDFTPEEMAYDAPRDVSDPKRFPTIGRDEKSWGKFLTFRNGFAKLRPEFREAFPDDAAVNEALDLVLKLRQLPFGKAKRRKTA